MIESPIEKLSLENKTFIKSLLKRFDKLYFTKSGKLRKKLNSKDIYQKDILDSCLRIHSTIRTLSQSRIFLEERMKTIEDSGFKIKNGEFARYHIETFFLRMTTFKDLIFKLINRTLDLGINENIGLERKIRKYTDRENISDVSEILEGLDIIMKKFIPIRNDIAHGEYFVNYDLSIIESIQITNRKEIENNKYEKTFKKLINDNCIIMYGIELMMCALTVLIYSKLLPIRRNHEKLITLSKASSASLCIKFD